MISNLEEIMDEVFGEPAPDWARVHTLAMLSSDPAQSLEKIIKLQWLEINNPSQFDKVVVNEL